LGFIVDLLSHATIVGFMAGAATVVCLQQLKGMLGLVHFTTSTDVVSVMESVFSQTHQVRTTLWSSGARSLPLQQGCTTSRCVRLRQRQGCHRDLQRRQRHECPPSACICSLLQGSMSRASDTMLIFFGPVVIENSGC
jgi:hypothetical protein